MAYLRRLLRGHSWCKRNDGFAAIRKIRNELVDVVVESEPRYAAFFFGASAPSAELVVRQFVYDRYGVTGLNKALFMYRGSREPIRATLPPAWRKYLTSCGWPVNEFASTIRWQLAVVARLCHGVAYWGRLCIKLAMARAPESVLPQPFGYFPGLSPANLPSRAGGVTYDICTFYAQFPDRRQDVRSIRHDVKGVTGQNAGTLPVGYLPPPYELAGGFAASLRLTGWGVWASLLAVSQMLMGRSSLALMLAEAAKTKAVSLCHPEQLAVEYWFHASGAIYRPMWTYEVERLGANVCLYFYSTYDQPKLESGYEPQRFEWGPANWPRYIVWDEWQASILKRDLSNAIQVMHSGPVYFSDSGRELSTIPKRAVAVFDIHPYRAAVHYGISTLSECLSKHPDYHHRFLIDVAEAISACGANMVLKGKRDMGNAADKRYKRIIDALQAEEKVLIVPSDVSAMRVIAGCCAGISVPFTSTAIYLRELGLPSAYYDPLGWMQLDDGGAHGIPILQGKAELLAWLEKVLASNEQSVAVR